MKTKIFILLQALSLWLLPCFGEGFAPRASLSIEAGGGRDISTYLSPLYYSGGRYGVSAEWSRPFHYAPKSMQMSFRAAIQGESLMNRAKSARMLGATAYFGWGLAPYWNLGEHWRLAAGGMIDIYGGALWCPRNGNNPVTAIAYAGLDISMEAHYRFMMGRVPVRVGEIMTIPTAGAFFCPEYGESYYEIYLGNRHGLAHFGGWWNCSGIDNRLTATLKLGRRSLIVGWHLEWRYFRANGLLTDMLGNSALLGIEF